MNQSPYQDFGRHLKQIRQKAKETIAEVSGAVEIDTQALAGIEAGKIQPEEDVVLLLISHFALKEDEALKMWELAGYPQEKTGMSSLIADEKGITQTAYITPGDARIIYTDMVHVNANRFGVVINFLQGLGSNNQPMAISRIGMSHEHAKSLIAVLQKSVKLSEKPKTDKKSKK